MLCMTAQSIEFQLLNSHRLDLEVDGRGRRNMSEEWDIVDYYCYDCGNEEDGDEYDEKQSWWWSDKMSWAVDAGKKLVITGFVVSSAPVVLPPLLVVSALGLAMSVPFGFVFAAYASTNKLMTKLLPETVEKIDREQRLQWVGSDVTHDDDDDELMQDRYDDGEVGGEREGGVVEGEKNAGDVGTRLEEESEREVKDVESPEQEIPTSDENENENIDIEALNVDEEASKREELDSEKSNEQVSLIIEDGASGGGGGGGGSLDKHDEGIVLPAVAAAITTVPESDLDIGHKGEGERDGGYVSDGDSSDSVVLNGDRHSDKESEDEKKIWEKIDAIRVIVGFKAPRRSSSFEEVKALYLFTGIDPPSAPSSQLDDKVNFLMSVLGLKL